MTRLTVFVAAAVLILLGAAEAHHSYGDFLDETRSIAGTLRSIEFASPHTTLTIAAEDGTVYTAVWNATRQLELQGVDRGALKVGDALSVTGYPHKDPAAHEFAKLREVRRLADGWAWRMVDGRVTVSTY
jgi:hypothetical protein